MGLMCSSLANSLTVSEEGSSTTLGAGGGEGVLTGALGVPGWAFFSAAVGRVSFFTCGRLLAFACWRLPAEEDPFDSSAYWLWLSPETVKQLEAEGVLLSPQSYGPSWSQAREGALVRDGHQCRQCGAPERTGRKHDVHHIRPFREFGFIPGENRNDRHANDLDNLITLCPTCHQRAESARGKRSALGGLAYALGNIAPLYLMCDPRDLGVLSGVRAKHTKSVTVTIFDRIPDGMGLSERLYSLHNDLLQGAMDLVRTCRCRDGCPACVGPAGPGGQEVKILTVRLLETLLAEK